MTNPVYEKIERHIGHKIACSAYGAVNDRIKDCWEVAVECETCNEIIVTAVRGWRPR